MDFDQNGDINYDQKNLEQNNLSETDIPQIPLKQRNQQKEDAAMIISRVMIRWLDPEVSMWTKAGDLDLHFDILIKHFPFERLLLDAK